MSLLTENCSSRRAACPSSGGGVDLTAPRTLENPVEAVNTLAAAGLIPDCKGWRIYGVSPTTGLSDVDAARLKTFWLTFTGRCGGRLVSWTDHLATFPSTTSVLPADTTQLTLHDTTTQVTATLSDVIFDNDSADLRRDQQETLAALLVLVNATPGAVQINGYASPVGPPQRNLTLSRQRADSVARWLTAQGVDPDRITTAGKGSADPVYPHPTTPAQEAASRRVVVVIQKKG